MPLGGTQGYSAQEQARRHALGICLIVIVAIIWIAASFLVQALESDAHPMHPLVLTYICNALFLIYLPIAAVQDMKQCSSEPARSPPAHMDRASLAAASTSSAQVLELEADDTDAEIERLLTHNVPFVSDKTASIWRAALAVGPLWFLAALNFNYSLKLTSVTSNTILSSPSSLFTFGLSVLFLKERFSFGKLAAVFLTIMGTVLVAVADSKVEASGKSIESNGTGLLGDCLALVAAALYACYTVTMRAMLPDDSENKMFAFFGYMGLINLVIFAPFLLFLEVFSDYSIASISATAFSLAIIKGLFDNALADYLWARALLLVGPTIATVGMSLQVPIAVIVDPLLNVYGWWSAAGPMTLELSGAAAILAGFFIINLDGRLSSCFGL